MADDDWNGDFDDSALEESDFDDSDFEDSGESFGGRKDRRRPKGGRRAQELTTESTAEKDASFDDPGLKALHADGHLLELGRQVRGGKEATVYRAQGPSGPLAAKVYSDAEVRNFQSDEAYLVGRRINDRRIRKMLGDARRRGLSPRLAHWVFHEYQMLWRLSEAGIRVPRPAVGPKSDEMVTAGRVVLMEWIGDLEPAPRLSDSHLEADEIESAWATARALPGKLLDLGLVHGDLSTSTCSGGRVNWWSSTCRR